ncbi:MAG: SPOR domain-containing protein [Prolixibacteraceae bacterium]|nr:SPOR domain-containing protein [Prolixibacteraceae bacterium]
MKVIIAGIVFILLQIVSYAQESVREIADNSLFQKKFILNRINVNEDIEIDSLLMKYIAYNNKNRTTKGYRVEIYFNSGMNAKKEALRVKTQFLDSFPDIHVYVSYQSPDFIIRVGDCRVKGDALRLKNLICMEYPNAFIVPDLIQFPKLYTKEESTIENE